MLGLQNYSVGQIKLSTGNLPCTGFGFRQMWNGSLRVAILIIPFFPQIEANISRGIPSTSHIWFCCNSEMQTICNCKRQQIESESEASKSQQVFQIFLASSRNDISEIQWICPWFAKRVIRKIITLPYVSFTRSWTIAYRVEQCLSIKDTCKPSLNSHQISTWYGRNNISVFELNITQIFDYNFSVSSKVELN